MKITVKTVGKASYPVECEPETKIGELKEKIQAEHGL